MKGFIVLLTSLGLATMLSGCTSTNDNYGASSSGNADSDIALQCNLDPIEMRVYEQWHSAEPVKLELPHNEALEFVLLYNASTPVYRRAYVRYNENTVTMCTSESRLNRPTDECMRFSGTDEEFAEGKHAFVTLGRVMRGNIQCQKPDS